MEGVLEQRKTAVRRKWALVDATGWTPEGERRFRAVLDAAIADGMPEAKRPNSTESAYHASGFRGVIWDVKAHRWRASIKKNYVKYHLGMFDRRDDAARAYDRAARRLYGRAAHLNFPEES